MQPERGIEGTRPPAGGKKEPSGLFFSVPGCGSQHPRVPWAALASCWPLPQQLLPVSATGGGRRRCTLAIISGRIILNFGFQESLRTFLKPIFTGGDVEETGICSAAFCESAALRLASSPSPSLLRKSTSPKGRGFGSPREVTGFARGSPFGRAVTEGD